MGGGPWYVVKKDIQSNSVFVAHSEAYRTYARDDFIVANAHWICGPPAKAALQTKVRHSPHLENCTLQQIDSDRFQVTLENTDQGIAPGQSAVFYDGEYCLGTGVIEEAAETDEKAEICN